VAFGRVKQEKADKTLLDTALNQLRSAERHAEKIHLAMDRAQKVYLGRTNREYGRPRQVENPRDWRSRIFPPIAFEHVELMIAELSDSPPKFDATARLQAHEGQAKAAEKIVSYYLDHDRFTKKFRTTMRRSVKYGGCPVKIVWKHDCMDHRPVVDGVEQPCRGVMFDGPTVMPLDYRDFFPDPTAKDLCDASFVFHRFRATLKDLKNAGIYENLDQLVARPSGSADETTKKPNETQEAFEARTTGLHTLHERWTPCGVVTIANRTTIIRNQDDYEHPIFDHRKVPFEVIRLIEDDDNLFGVSMLLQMDELQELFWTFLNRLIDAINLAINPPMGVNEDGDPNSALYDVFPGARIPLTSGGVPLQVMEDIAALDKYSPQQLLELCRDLIERTTGMNASVAGLAQSGSATEAAGNLRQSKGRIASEISTSDEDWSRVAEMVFQLVQQFAEPMTILKIVGQEYDPEVHAAPPEITGQFMFTSKLSSERAMLELRMQNLQSLWETITPMMAPGSVPINGTPVLQAMCEVFGLPPDAVVRPSNYMDPAMQPQQEQQPPPEQPAPVMDPAMEMLYKNGPPDVRRQIEAKAGIEPSKVKEESPRAPKPKPPGGTKSASKKS
jgi:hypothetical protein